MFPVKDALMYIQTGGKLGQGSTYYLANNPDFGATFTYYLKEAPKSLKSIRQASEKRIGTDQKDIPFPGWEALEKEKNEEKEKKKKGKREKEEKRGGILQHSRFHSFADSLLL